MKFKVGDKVRVVDNCGVTSVKSKYIGKVFTIGSTNSSCSYPYAFKPDIGWAWCDEELECAYDAKIVIITDGKITIATKYCEDGTKVVATARCAPEDTFDFNVGAKLAMERLMKETEKPEPPKYYNGKVVCVDLCGCNIGFYTVGKIYEVVDGVFTDDNGYVVPTFFELKFESFDDLKKYSCSKWLEIKE